MCRDGSSTLTRLETFNYSHKELHLRSLKDSGSVSHLRREEKAGLLEKKGIGSQRLKFGCLKYSRKRWK